MKRPDWLKNKVLILGMGREGQVTQRFITTHYPDVEIAVADLREWTNFSPDEQKLLDQIKPGNRFLGKNYLDSLKDFEVIIKTPGENRRKPQIQSAIRRGALVTSATNLFFELKAGKVIAVTGSKGKSTTASLIYNVLREGGLKVELIGNIGRPALDYLDADGPDQYFVYEMSSYQLEDYRGGADIAVLVSFFPDHLDYHGSLEDYFKAKMQLAAQVKPGLKVVYNYGSDILRDYFDAYSMAFADDVEMFPYNDAHNSFVIEEDGQFRIIWKEQVLLRENEVKLQGKHNLENILAAVQVGSIIGIPLENIKTALKEFHPLEHRLESVGVFKEIYFYNDAISTTPESTMAALDTLGRKRKIGSLIVGGLDRGYNFIELAQKILDRGVENVILLPDTGAKIEHAMQRFCRNRAGGCPKSYHCSNMDEVVARAFEITPPGTICLMSCASPSYNLFKNFEEKGRLFKEAIKKMAG